MKTYKVTLLDVNGDSVLNHNLMAFDDADANKKAKVLVSNCLDKKVVSFKLS
jgi:hypothetical protein